MKPQTQTAKHTQGDLKVCDGALLCPDINNYGNFIVASCERERNAEDDSNLERLALCWNQHDQLIAQRDALLAVVQSIEADYDQTGCSEDIGTVRIALIEQARAAIARATGRNIVERSL